MQNKLPEHKPVETKSNTTKIILILLGIIVLCACCAGAVVVALLATGSKGVETVQTNSRDLTRRSAAQDVNQAIVQFFTLNASYPDYIEMDYREVTVGGYGKDSVDLDIPAIASLGTGRLSASISNIGETKESTTEWCFIPNLADGYALGVKKRGWDLV